MLTRNKNASINSKTYASSFKDEHEYRTANVTTSLLAQFHVHSR